MESNKGRGSLTSRYLAALLAPAVIAGVMQVTWPFFEHNPVLPYLLAVIFCAWYGGLGPGLLSVVISFLLTDFFFVEPYFFFWFPKQVDLVRLLLFAVVGPFISVMSELMHRARRRAGINLESAKRAERSLREKERFANQIAELSPVVINVFDLATRRDVYISPDVVNLLGYTPKEIAEMEDPFSVLWHPEDIPRASENLARLKHARDGEIAEFEYRIRRRDGEWRWVATRGISFERDEHGEVRQIVTATLDITGRKLVERAQRESQRQYETLVQSIDGIVWEADPRTFTFAFVSKQAERILGYPLEQWFEGPSFWLDHMHPDDRDWTVAFCVDATDRRVDHQFEYRMIAADGHVVWLSDIVTVHVGDDQSVLLRGVMVDITERKRVEAALRESTRKLNATVNNLSGFVYRCVNHPDWPVEYMSQGIFDLLGYQPEEFVSGKRMFGSFIAPADRDRVWAEVQAGVEARRPYVLEYRVHTASGEERWVWEKGAGVFDDEKLLALEGFITDITARKRAEEALRESEERYRELFENAKDAIYVQDLAGVYTSVNRAAEKLSGYNRDEILGKHFEQFVAPEYLPLVCAKFSKKLADTEQTAYEVEVIARDGERVPIELSSALILKHGVPVGIQGIARDITERKRAEETLRSYSRQLIDAQEAERQHIARELHDQIGQVLTAIRINLQTIENSCETAESRPLIDQGVALIDAALEQVRDLSFELRPSLLDNLGLVAALRWYSDQYTRRTGIRTRSVTNLPGGQTRLTQELETACFRIVQEALTNVVRHANAKNVSIDLRKLDHKIVLSIKDDGVGFDELSPNGGASATRLGLRGMKERALALGGTLEIASAPAQGTEIRAYFPTESKGD